jgi:hypothetical protein
MFVERLFCTVLHYVAMCESPKPEPFPWTRLPPGVKSSHHPALPHVLSRRGRRSFMVLCIVGSFTSSSYAKSVSLLYMMGHSCLIWEWSVMSSLWFVRYVFFMVRPLCLIYDWLFTYHLWLFLCVLFGIGSLRIIHDWLFTSYIYDQPFLPDFWWFLFFLFWFRTGLVLQFDTEFDWVLWRLTIEYACPKCDAILERGALVNPNPNS